MAINRDYLEVMLNNEFREVFKSNSDNTLNENIETSLAIAAFIEKRVTLAKAAQLADKDLSEFIKILSKYKIPWMEYTEETFEEDQDTLEELRGSAND